MIQSSPSHRKYISLFLHYYRISAVFSGEDGLKFKPLKLPVMITLLRLELPVKKPCCCSNNAKYNPIIPFHAAIAKPFEQEIEYAGTQRKRTEHYVLENFIIRFVLRNQIVHAVTSLNCEH
jgi:hypothetical protein